MTAPLTDQQLDEIEEFLDVWDTAPAHRTRYRDVISSQKSGEDGRKLRATTLRALLAEIRRLRGENEQLSDLEAAATRRIELQAERDRAVARWHDEHQRAETAEAALAEMTLCRDNAIRAAERADQPIEFHLDEQLRDGLAGIAEWEHPGEPDQAPDWLIDAVVRVVRPELARLASKLAAAESGLSNAMGAWENEAEALEAERDELRARIGNARSEIRTQDTAATIARNPGFSDVCAALAAVETHLVDPEHRPAERGAAP